MAYYATQDAGSTNYGVYQVGGGRVATTAAMGLSGYGLSESNLGSSTSSPAATPVTPTQTPASTPTQPSTPNLTGNPNNLNTYFQAGNTGNPLSSPVQSTTVTSNGISTSQTTLTPAQQSAYYASEGNKANPLSPIAWLATQNGTASSVNTPAAPSLTSIGNVVSPPTTSGTPTLPQGTAVQAVSTFTTGVASTLAAQTTQLTQAFQLQQAKYQDQIDAANKAANDASSMAQLGLASENAAVSQEVAQKQAALQQEQQQYTDNYNAIQGLAAKASSLVDTAQQLTAQMQNTTGLSSIMQPRISQTAANLTAELAVINGAVNIYSGQIGSAQNQLKSATDAITSIYSDQISYYQNIVNFYSGQQKDQMTLAASLTTAQKGYIDAQIQQLSDQVAQTQATATYISQAMVNPNTALQFAQAGVTLNDTIPQITAKLATAAYSAELSTLSQTMAAKGYSATNTGFAPVQVKDSQGNVSNWYPLQNPNPPTSAARPTQADQLATGTQNLLNVITTNKPLPNGDPITDSGGNITPEAFKLLAAQAPSEGMTRNQFIQAVGGYLFGSNSQGNISPAYGLTPAEAKLIGATIL